MDADPMLHAPGLALQDVGEAALGRQRAYRAAFLHHKPGDRQQQPPPLLLEDFKCCRREANGAHTIEPNNRSIGIQESS